MRPGRFVATRLPLVWLCLAAGADFAGCGERNAKTHADAGGAADGGGGVEKASQPLFGCSPDRPAIAHSAGGTALSTQPPKPPIPCSSDTGTAAFDAVIVTTPDGKVLFSPAAGSAIMRSSDNGTNWEGPLSPSGAPSGLLHPWLWRDSSSGRLFLSGFSLANGVSICTSASGSYLWTSDDDGSTWESHPAGCDSKDFGKVISGKPATAASAETLKQNGYPSIVYFCATGPTVLTGPNRFCYRSLDGGNSFVRTASDPVDMQRGQRGWPEAGAVAPDGSIYVAHVSDTGLAIAISRDEGDSWQDVFVGGSSCDGKTRQNWLSANVTTDSDGNVYAVWVDDNDLLPYLSISRDRGTHWSMPIMVGAPEVRHARYPSIAVKQPSYVAIAYYGSADAAGNGQDGYFTNDGRAYDAYLTVTSNVFAEEPVLWSAIMHDPQAHAIPNGMSYSVSEYIGAPAFGPDGSIWAGFMHAGNGLAARLTPPPRSP